MAKLPLFLLAILIVWPIPVIAIDLKPAEKANVQNLGSIKVCVDPDWLPYEQITNKGEYVGIAADIVTLIIKRIGGTFQLVPTKNWEESLAYSQTGKCDILAFLNKTPEREKWLIFTEPYFTNPNVFITREGHDYIADPAELSESTIALPSGTSIEERVRRDFPNLNIITVASETEAFRLVEERKADMTLRALTTAVYTIKREGWFNLKIAGEIPAYANRMCIGVVNDKPLLRDILNKGVASLNPQEVGAIVNRHVSMVVAHRIDFVLLGKIAVGFAIVFSLGLVWVVQLRRLNRKLSVLTNQLLTDISERKRLEHALQESEEHYRKLVETAREGIIVAQDDRLAFFNPMFATITGYSREELEDIPFLRLINPEDHELAMANRKKRLAGEGVDLRYQIRLIHKNGSTIWLEMSGTLIDWKNRPATLNFVIDVTEKRHTEERIKYMAQHDALTGLANRAMLVDRLQQALLLARREKKRLALCFIDLDKFKPVNDTYGHGVGDLLLQSVAQRIKNAVRDSDTVARVGGDEFVLLLPSIESFVDAEKVGQKVRAALNRFFDVAEHPIEISASIGIAVFPDHGESDIDLFKNADTAMYCAKNHGRNDIVMFDGDASSTPCSHARAG